MTLYVPSADVIFKKVRTIVVYALLIFTVASGLPARTLAAPATPAPQAKETNAADTQQFTQPALPAITSPQEIESRRTEYASVYRMPDGTNQMQISANPIHFETTENGQKVWKDIDTKLVASGQGYRNGANQFSLSLPQTLENNPVTVTSGQHSVGFVLDTPSQTTKNSFALNSQFLSTVAAPSVSIENNRIDYARVFPNTTVRYFSTETGIKEEIILDAPNSQKTFTYHVKTTLEAQKQESGSIYFVDRATKKTIFAMPPLLMWDAKGGKDSPDNAYSEAITTNVVPEDGGYGLTIVPSQEWLNDAARVYPIVVDPTLVVNIEGNGEDSYLEQRFPTTKTWDQRNLYVGYDTTTQYPKGITRSLIHFNIPDLTDALIKDATFSVRQTACAGVCSSTGITANLVTDYNPTDVYWNKQPYLIKEVGYRFGNPGSNYTMSVTDALYEWYRDGNGYSSKIGSLEFKFDTETQRGYQIWTAKNDPNANNDQKPKLTVNYKDYGAFYGVGQLDDMYNDDLKTDVSFELYNTGRNTWSASDTHLSYHIYDPSGNLVLWDGERTILPRDVGPHGDHVHVNARLRSPKNAGDYTIRWDMVKESVAWFSDEGVPTENRSLHVENLPAYGAGYFTQDLSNMLVDQSRDNVEIAVQNLGRYTWDKNRTFLSYHVYDPAGNLITQEGVRTALTRNVEPKGDYIVLNANLKAPSFAGDFVIRWDLVEEGVTWFSSQGVATFNKALHVDDYPLYGAQYNINTPPPSTIAAGSTVTIPMSVTNLSRQAWTVGTFVLSYHWVEKETGKVYIFDGAKQNFANTVSPRGGIGAITLNAKAPINAGSYTLKIDMQQPGTKWFSDAGVATANYDITVTNPSFSSAVHLGSEKYYTKSGPVDLTTGSLAFSSVDMTLPSNTGLLSVGRSYNSTSFDTASTLDANGYVRDWLLNGPYKEDNQTNRLSKPFISNESSVQPSAGMISTNNLWLKTSSDASATDFNTVLEKLGSVQNGYAKNSTIYAHTYLYAPATKTYRLKFGSADGLKVWVNGNNILTKDVLRSLTLDSDSVDVVLNEGWNRVMVKVAHASSQWALSTRVLNTDGTVPSGITISTGNQDSYVTTATMGQGWRTSFDESLNVSDVDNIVYQDGTGAVDIFTRNSTGTYKRPTGLSIDLVKNSDNTYTIISKSGLKTNFSATGLLVKRVDLSGNSIEYQRDANGNVVKIVDGGRKFTLTYTGKRLDSIANDLGQKITYTYDTTKTPVRLIKVTDPLGGVYSYEYTTAGKLNKLIDKNNVSSLVVYDLNGRVVEVKDGLSNSSKLVYKDRAVEVTDALGHVSKSVFDANNLLINVTNAKGYKEIYTNDGNYNIVAITPDLAENESYYYKYTNTYDQNDNLLVAKDPMGNTTTNEYVGNDLVKNTDAKGNITTYTYSTDGRRLLLSQKDPNGNVESTTYDAKGRKLTQTDANGGVTKYTYSADADLLTTVTPKSETTTFTYDTVGRKLTEKSAMGAVITNTYDNLGRLISVKDQAGLTNSYAYDKNSNKIKETDPKGNITQYQYDALNNLVKVVDPLGATITHQYDAVGNKVKTIDAKGKATTYAYDELNQVVKQTNALGYESSVQYDRNGNIVKTTDSLGNTVTNTVDKNGQLTSVKAADGTTNISYDQVGNVTGASSTVNNEAATLQYDKNENVTKLSSSVLGNQAVAYDKNDNAVTSTVATATITTVYDTNDEVSQISTKMNENGQTLTNSLAKDSDGRLKSIKKANGDTTSYTYDISGRVTQVANQYSFGATQELTTYGYDANSNIMSMSDSVSGSATYDYDARNQLTRENDVSYTYDVMGNRVKKTNKSETVTYAYDELGDANRLLRAESNTNGIASYEYDKAGNVVKKLDKTGTTLYTYDADGYFVKAILPNKATVEYTYDKLTKLRASRTETNPTGTQTITKYVYSGDKLVSETNTEGKIVRSYTWDEDENLFSVTIPDDKGVLQTYYYLKNGHSDITGLTDASGNKLVTYSYDAWGNLQTASSVVKGGGTGVGGKGGSLPDPVLGVPTTGNLDTLNPRLYAGYWFDRTLGLYFMKTRMYDPGIGRFLSTDPVIAGDEALDLNPYIYTANNPVNRIDPDGKAWRDALSNSWNWIKQNKAVIAGVAVGIVIGLATAGLGTGLAAAIIIGAITGAAAKATEYVIANKGHITAGGVGKAIVSGAVVGGATAGLGYVAGKAISTVASNYKIESALGSASKVARAAYNDTVAASSGTRNVQLAAGKAAHKAWTDEMEKRMPIKLNYNTALPGAKIRPDAWADNGIGFELKTALQANSSRTLKQVGSYQKLGVAVRIVTY